MTVRQMKYALPIIAVFAWAGPAPAAPFSEPPRLEKPQAGFYRFKIGKVDVIAVNDGAASFDVLGVLAKDKRAARRAIVPTSVDEIVEWLSLGRVEHHVASGLPYGFQKVLGMGIGLAARPRLIMLDEPAAGLSAEETDDVRDTIRLVRERGISVVVIDHNMRFISDLCDRVLVMAQGRELACGTPQEVLRNVTVIEAYLGKRYAQADH
jgi:ABC-type branched-subunit amino acid transport system ATPase component